MKGNGFLLCISDVEAETENHNSRISCQMMADVVATGTTMMMIILEMSGMWSQVPDRRAGVAVVGEAREEV